MRENKDDLYRRIYLDDNYYLKDSLSRKDYTGSHYVELIDGRNPGYVVSRYRLNPYDGENFFWPNTTDTPKHPLPDKIKMLFKMYCLKGNIKL